MRRPPRAARGSSRVWHDSMSREAAVLKIGIVGLSQAGKSTLFRALTHAHHTAAPAGKPDARVGVVRVPDSRLDRLAELHGRLKTVYASLEFVDTPGSIIDLARSGEKAAVLREMDALAHVVRSFEDETLPAPSGVNPRRDVESVELELVLSDLAVAEKRLERLEKDLKKQKSPALEKEQRVLGAVKAALERQTALREVAPPTEEDRLLRGFAFLSSKPMLIVLNVGESDAARAQLPGELAAAGGIQARPKTMVAAVCGKIEAELAELNDADATEFLSSYGLQVPAAARLIRASFDLLGLISFFTIGENECRSWTIAAGRTAFEAAGEVHTDFQKKFIRAEIVKFDDLAEARSLAEARNRGLMKLEGKDYILHDGEVVYFRHSA